MTPSAFISKWQRVQLPERAASQEHFLDLCRLLGQPTPAEHDATGAEYTFEKGVKVDGPASKGSAGKHGYADVWWKGKFAIEYKRKDKHKSLADAYRQLNRYREPLANPPLLIVTDIARFEIHTNFTGYVPTVHELSLEDFDQPDTLDKLRRVFTDPQSFKPQESREQVTTEVAKRFSELATSLNGRHPDTDPLVIAHFLMKCMFCLFAEDVELLPTDLFKNLLLKSHDSPEKLKPRLEQLFSAMATGGDFGIDEIAYFNGGLFKDGPVFDLTHTEIGTLILAASKHWDGVDPSIFGTLFERSLDPTKRAQIGAHYTSRDDIMLVIEPVILRPLRREWDAVRDAVDQQLDRRRKATTAPTKRKADDEINNLLGEFMTRLGSVRVLDPACGSGNFLFVAIQCLLDLEKQVLQFAAQPEIGTGLLPNVRPSQLHGIEINPFAAELAQVVIWIGYLQWMRDNGFNVPRNPILEDLQTIENRDAILDLSDPEKPTPAKWPDVEFIVGNPPFLGSTQFEEFGIPETYKNSLYSTYGLRGKSDLCCFWVEHACRLMKTNPELRTGLLGNTTIRFGVSRDVFDHVKREGVLFDAWDNRKWINDGASVRVCIACFTGSESETRLNGMPVDEVFSDLSAKIDITSAEQLVENAGISFEGDQKGGPFDTNWQVAREILKAPNPNGRLANELIRPRYIAKDITRRANGGWLIDFGSDISKEGASQCAFAFQVLEDGYTELEEAAAKKNKKFKRRGEWWLHKCWRPEMRRAIHGLRRTLVTPRVAKHRLFAFVEPAVVPDSRLFAFAVDSDYWFGILQSNIHSLWALAAAPPHGVGNDPTYSATTCFETFALPWPPGEEAAEVMIDPDPTDSEAAGQALMDHEEAMAARDVAVAAISDAAKELNELRENWLNPPEWIEPIARRIDAQDAFSDVPADARPLIRQSAIMAAAAQDKQLKKRTLTNLYNQRPTWLRLAHEKLDRAVLAAYAQVDPEGGWDPDWSAVWVETGAGQPLPEGHELAERRSEVEQSVLANLLRLNQQRVEGQ